MERIVSGPRYLCIHGHFYQPPRENPWLEALEQQESAWPKHDWNERVTDECYAPNTHARILDEKGRIDSITNNYAHMSFNLGPTLLGWMEQARPEVYADIVDADRASQERFDGHGAAMAQVYNHMIMPLANRRDRITQVRWGIRDFVRRFARKPEGMWLAETAVDVESLEILAEHDIRYTVLAPHQCRRVRKPGGSWEDMSGQHVDPRRPYLAKLPSGRTIALFFYDGPISRAVAFERLLDDGYRFAERLLGAFDRTREEPQLVHIATDGETYGHHHKHGEMALAVALRKLESERSVELVTYGQVLDRLAPTWEAEIIENTSWSCAHGIERWRSDCGCSSGSGMHQKWRAPLRKALDWLRDEVSPHYEREAAALFTDPWAARDAYIDVVLDRSPQALEAFLSAQGVAGLDREGRRRALELSELMRHAMLMYTSCGWFFDEISGIETVQVLRYAARAMQLAEALFLIDLEPAFRAKLAQAPSNRPEYATGDGVYEALVSPAKVDLATVGACFAINTIFEDTPERSSLGGFDGELVDRNQFRTGPSRLSVGRVRVSSRITTEEQDYEYSVLHLGDHNILGGIRPFTSAARHLANTGAISQAFSRADLTEVVRLIERLYDGKTFSLRTQFYDEQAAILDRLLADRTSAVEEQYESIYEQTAPLMRFLQSLDHAPPPAFRTAAEYTLMARLRRELAEARKIDLRRVTELIEEARSCRAALDPISLGLSLQRALEDMLAELKTNPEDVLLLSQLARLASFAAASDWKMELGVAQTEAWKLARASLPLWSKLDEPSARDRNKLVRSIAADLGIRVPD
jgi:alpha-amylase/alpha-mannosidase (GH57 family)